MLVCFCRRLNALNQLSLVVVRVEHEGQTRKEQTDDDGPADGLDELGVDRKRFRVLYNAAIFLSTNVTELTQTFPKTAQQHTDYDTDDTTTGIG